MQGGLATAEASKITRTMVLIFLVCIYCMAYTSTAEFLDTKLGRCTKCREGVALCLGSAHGPGF